VTEEQPEDVITYEELRAELLAGAQLSAEQEKRYMLLLQRVDLWDKRHRHKVLRLEAEGKLKDEEIKRLKIRINELAGGA
jgi:hypothetical protein